ncbi:alanine racemase [Aeromicrobium ginsengisoli]|uniref:Alanine racemase n=1 Tax=Aeromicrobium ginsengisoli TaxID=363867 RepID=A0A5M4FBS6_9ACTN|nr:alanine racemase [Aeromicrobium ginsengisoli]KAA1395755.1 alanine racemase [Aeromicrobium ginsengisoli]
MLTAESLTNVETPAVVIDLDQVERNIKEMFTVADAHGVRLRPHIKSHKIPELMRLQLAGGAIGATCATLREVEVMIDAGCPSVTLAFPPLSADKIARLVALREHAEIRVTLDSVEAATVLGQAAGSQPFAVLLEIDTGQGRLGRPPGAPSVELGLQIAAIPGVRLIGVSSHAGHAYAATSQQDLARIASDEADDLVRTAEELRRNNVDVREISVGSTPSARAGFGLGMTESRPGTYVMNDANMVRLGVATHETCAAFVLATVISRPAPDRVVIDAGTKMLSSDGFGGDDWVHVLHRPDLHPAFLSEEHGVFHADDPATAPAIGDRVLVIPHHVCTMMNLADEVHLVSDGGVTDTVPVSARGH